MSKKILVVDDNEDILEVIKDILTEDGYEAETLAYTNDICKSVSKVNPDLVILDYILFGINGGELCHQVKTNPATAHIPVIMVSAYPRVLSSLGNYGADDFLAKPFMMGDLLNSVKNCLFKTAAVEQL
jgi:DNA-binding response OmpR family regulator